MPLDFNAALAKMHAAADDVFAVAASFRPASGAAVACRVEKLLPEAEFGLSDAKAVVADVQLKVLKAGLPKRPGRGDRFDVTLPNGATESWRVLAEATIEDDDGLRYSVKVERA